MTKDFDSGFCVVIFRMDSRALDSTAFLYLAWIPVHYIQANERGIDKS